MRVVKLLSIELKNWRQLKSFKQDFQHGITCIVGPNGVGKSSLLDAIMFSLTESWGADYKKKAHNIRFGAKGESYVKAKWQINDVRIEIEKDLRKNKSKLRLPDGRVLTAAAEIATELETLFGAPRGILENAVFISQGKVDSFLHLTKSGWLEYIGQFCELDRIEKIRDALQEQLAKDSQLVRGDTRSEIKQLRLQLLERKSRLVEVSRTVRKYKKRLLTNPKQHVKKLHQLRTALTAIASRKQLLMDVAAAKKNYLEAKLKYAPDITQLKQELLELETRKQAFVTNSKRWYRLVQAYDERVKTKQQLATDTDKLSSVLAETATLEAKAAAARRTVDDVTAQYTTLTRARADLVEKEKALDRKIKFLEKGVCPTCGGKISDRNITKAKEEFSNVSREVTASLNAEKELLQSQTELNNELRQVTEKLDESRAVVTRLQQSVKLRKATLQELPKTSAKKIKAIRSRLVAATMFFSKRNDLDKRLNKLRTIVSQAKSTYATLTAQLVKTKKIADKYGQSADAIKKQIEIADAALTRHYKAKAKLKANRDLLVDYRQDVETLAESLHKSKRLANEQKQLTTWLRNLTEWRELLHRDKLQRIIVENYLLLQITKINDWLARFHCPFTVLLDEDLTLLAKKSSGDIHTVRQLSGGQKTMLAIAFRLAANDQSLLVLDEPTAGVDSDKLDKFAEFLSELSTQLKREGRQLLLVTHDDRLLGQSLNHRKAVFDNVIRFT